MGVKPLASPWWGTRWHTAREELLRGYLEVNPKLGIWALWILLGSCVLLSRWFAPLLIESSMNPLGCGFFSPFSGQGKFPNGLSCISVWRPHSFIKTDIRPDGTKQIWKATNMRREAGLSSRLNKGFGSTGQSSLELRKWRGLHRLPQKGNLDVIPEEGR